MPKPTGKSNNPRGCSGERSFQTHFQHGLSDSKAGSLREASGGPAVPSCPRASCLEAAHAAAGEASQGKLLNFASLRRGSGFAGCQPHSNPLRTSVFSFF